MSTIESYLDCRRGTCGSLVAANIIMKVEINGFIL